MESVVLAGVLQGGRAERHVFDELIVAELVAFVLRPIAAARVEDEPPAADFALSEQEQSDLGGSGPLIRGTATETKEKSRLKKW